MKKYGKLFRQLKSALWKVKKFERWNALLFWISKESNGQNN